MGWKTYTFLCGTVPIITFVMMFFAPESPLYLISKGHDADAVLALMHLRGATVPTQIENELADVSYNELHLFRTNFLTFSTFLASA